jgi:hypothetical protein
MRIFDIVNGFFNRCRDDTASIQIFGSGSDRIEHNIIWLRLFIHIECHGNRRGRPGYATGPSSVVDGGVDSQA